MKMEYIKDKILEFYFDIPETEDLPDSIVFAPVILDTIEDFMMSNSD